MAASAQGDPHGEPIIDESFLLVLHAGAQELPFTLPGPPWATGYELMLDTTGAPTGGILAAGAAVPMTNRSVLLLKALRTRSRHQG